MIEIVRYSSLKIPKTFDKKFCDSVKNHLTRTIKDFNNSTVYTWNFFLEDDDYIYIPRYYPIENLIGCKIIDKRNDGEDIQIKHNIMLRNELQKTAFEYMLGNDNGIVKLDTGAGKTVITIAYIATIKKKTLILLHRTNLIQQWVREIEKFTNIKFGKGVGILDNSKIEESLANSIVISTVQTFLSAIDRKKEEFVKQIENTGFGVMIADELHTTIGGRKFSECSLFVPTKRVFGLSATPYRKDGTGDILTYHLGEIFDPSGDSGILDARVTFLLFDFGLLPKSYKYIYWAEKFQRSRYLNLLKKSDILNKICLSLLNKFVKEERSIFLISERIKFIRELYNKFEYENKNTFIENDKNENLKNQVVFATPGKIRDGIDVPEKDCLIITSPIGNIHQLSGRIVRQSLNKKEPIIIDMVDIGCKDISRTFYNRLKFYREKKWKIQFILLTNERISINLDMAIKIIKEYPEKKIDVILNEECEVIDN